MHNMPQSQLTLRTCNISFERMSMHHVTTSVSGRRSEFLKPSVIQPRALPTSQPGFFVLGTRALFAAPVMQVFSMSLSSSILGLPTQWKVACITPIAKIAKPSSPADYLPSSIASFLSRCIERFVVVVRSDIYPATSLVPPTLSFTDQFVFDPTGFTTAAIYHSYRKWRHFCSLNSSCLS